MAERVGPAGEVLAANIRRVRNDQRLGYAELSRLLTDIGRPIPELGLRRIEIGERRVDFDDLLAICLVLEIAPVDLLVPDNMADQSYQVTPLVTATADNVREWIRGESLLYSALEEPDTSWVTPVGGRDITTFTHWMPEQRRRQVLQRWLDMEKQDQWVREHEDEIHQQEVAEREQRGTEQ